MKKKITAIALIVACLAILGYVTYAYNISGGSVVRWYRDALAGYLRDEAREKGVSIYDLINDQCPAEPTDLMILPFLQGMGGTPDVEYGEMFNSGAFIPDVRNSAETNAGETLGGWIGTYVDFNEADSNDPTKYKWVKFTADVDEDLKNLKETITLLSTDVTNTSKEISLLAEKDYIERDEYKEFKEHTEAAFTQTADDITMEFEKTVELIDNASAANSAEIESAFTELKSYIRYYMNDSGQPVIELGASSSPLTCKLLNDKISFLDNGVEVAYLSNNQLYITDATILTSMNIGNFKILPRSNGNLSIM